MKWCIAAGEKWLTREGQWLVDKGIRQCFDTRGEALGHLAWWRESFPTKTFRLVRLTTVRERLMRALKRDRVVYSALAAQSPAGFKQGFYTGRAHEARMLRKEFEK